jgi:hypothetical protein
MPGVPMADDRPRPSPDRDRALDHQDAFDLCRIGAPFVSGTADSGLNVVHDPTPPAAPAVSANRNNIETAGLCWRTSSGS